MERLINQLPELVVALDLLKEKLQCRLLHPNLM
jgi:hypothetical protein